MLHFMLLVECTTISKSPSMRLPVRASFFRPFDKPLLLPSCAPLPSALFVEPFVSALVHVGVLPFRGCCHLQRDLHPANFTGLDLSIFRSHPQHGFSSISTNRFFPS